MEQSVSRYVVELTMVGVCGFGDWLVGPLVGW